jgi:hypothetical protein
MSARFLMVSRFPVLPGKATALIERLSNDDTRRTFISYDENEILELRAFADDLSLLELSSLVTPVAVEMAGLIAGDVRRELLNFVEAPKPTNKLIPDTKYVQLRHVEVRPEQMSAYRKWREETIFDVVRSNDEIEIFLAYHSVISGQPGVMFVSGFSCDPADYDGVFTSDRYRGIVRQAGDSYITGGTQGLYTKIYREAMPLAA